MAHPYKAAAHKNDPKWIKGLETEQKNTVFQRADTEATMRPRIMNPAITKLATYDTIKKGK